MCVLCACTVCVDDGWSKSGVEDVTEVESEDFVIEVDSSSDSEDDEDEDSVEVLTTCTLSVLCVCVSVVLTMCVCCAHHVCLLCRINIIVVYFICR